LVLRPRRGATAKPPSRAACSSAADASAGFRSSSRCPSCRTTCGIPHATRRRSDTLAPGLPPDVRAALRAPSADGAATDIGVRYKRAEIGIVSKLDNPSQFFGPGYLSSFNPGNTDFTLHLISLFGNVVKLLGVNGSSPREVILDSGCGYSWTTEWLAKNGFEVIGVDICRAYLEVGIARMGESHPHLVVADVENLPIADGCADAVLAYESFHYIPVTTPTQPRVCTVTSSIPSRSRAQVCGSTSTKYEITNSLDTPFIGIASLAPRLCSTATSPAPVSRVRAVTKIHIHLRSRRSSIVENAISLH
jgi:hypothetical protein